MTKSMIRKLLHISSRGETCEAVSGYDKMIMEGDADDFAGFAELMCNLDILAAGFGISARMVMA